MTSDGTNTYSYDAENRLLQVIYPGEGNYSQFVYDGFGHCVEIDESSGGTISSVKQFVWDFDSMREARDASGTALSQYFDYGQTLNGSSYFYTRDHLGSVRELIDSSGNVQGQFEYDPYGRVASIQGTVTPDFQFAGYYFHEPSHLSLAVHRAYNSNLGRWINRDPIAEGGGVNLYNYVSNRPVSAVDPSGEFVFLAPIAVAIAISSGTVTAEIAAGTMIGIGIGIGLSYGGGGNGGGNCKTRKRDCDDIRNDLYKAMDELQGRLSDLRNDNNLLNLYTKAYDLPNPSLPPNSGTWVGHLQQAQDWQNRIRNLIAEAQRNKCPIPSAAYGFASTKFPSQPGGN